MKISVIVPVYNCKQYLPACLDSILSQTYTDLEIILVDDGSSDGSSDICDSYAVKDQRINVVHQKNQGVSVARNTGIDIAQGELIAFVDSDDSLETDMYEILVKLLLEYDTDIAHCGYRKVFFDGTSKDVLGTEALIIQNGLQACECVVSGKYFTGSPCTKLYRKHLFDGIRFDPNLKINEDILLNIQLFQKANKLIFWDVPKYLYYEREQSATRKTNHFKIKNDCVSAAESMLNLLKGTFVERACLERLFYALVDLYRLYIFEQPKDKSDQDIIHKRLYQIKVKIGKIPARIIWNYRFMRYLPKLYVLVYRLYAKLTVANNDI